MESFGRQGSKGRWIESFHDQPDRQNHFLHRYGNRQEDQGIAKHPEHPQDEYQGGSKKAPC